MDQIVIQNPSELVEALAPITELVRNGFTGVCIILGCICGVLVAKK